MKEDKVRKLEDNELEDVSGGIGGGIIIRKLPFVEGQDNVESKTAIMSGDTNPDPLLLNGTGGAIVRQKTVGTGGAASGGGIDLLNQGGQKA